VGSEGKAAVTPSGAAGAVSGTEADRLRTQYKAIGDAQGHKFGEGLPGQKPPDFNRPPEVPRVEVRVPPAPGPRSGTANQPPGGPPR
jgi:hypothetical protein